MKRKFVLALVASMAMLGAKADGPFRNARWDSFHCLKPAGTDIVFVGNSITNMHQWWEALGGQNNVLNRGTSGGFTTEVLPNLETIIAGHPAKVFIGIGTNDICETLSLETTADNVRIIAERIRRESPETEVYIQSLIPSTHNGSAPAGSGRGRGARIPQINQLYKQHAEALNAKYGKVTYLDVNSPLAAADGISLKRSAQNQSIAFDNLHPNAVGYKYWLDAIKDATGFECVYKEQTMVGGMDNNNAFGDCLTSFEQFPVKATDILMVGSDAIHNGEWHEFMKSPDFKNRGLGWGKFSIAFDQLYTIVERSLAAEGSVAPKAIVLYADKGCNNSVAAATQMETLKAAISQIKAKAPGSEIFVISTLPNTAAAKNAIVTELNTLLANNAVTEGYTFVDAYSAIDANRALYMNNTDYVYTRGYAKMAQVLAKALNDKLGTHYNPITEDEAAANVANYEARTTLGNAITSALRFNNDKYKGEGIGQYSAVGMSGLDNALTTSFSLLNSNYTAEQLSAQATTLAGEVPTINMPTPALVEGKQWQIVALRGNRYVSSNGVGQGVTGKEANNQNYSRWTLSQREDGSWNFQNVADASYLVPASGSTNQLVTSASVPSLGWTFAGSQTPGAYIVSSDGGIQLHTLGSYNIANWGGGSNTADEGCQFRIVEIEGEPDVLPDTPEHGKVFTVYNDHVGTPYYLNDQLTSSCTALTTTEADDKSQQWIVWGNATSGYKFYNVKNPSQLLTCNAGVQNLDISTAHSKIGVSLRNHGTNQHMAGNKSTLTLNGGKFSADNAQYNETGDWSTDFVFLATGENAYKVASENVSVSGKPYANGDWVITTTELTTADVTVEEGYKAVITNNTITAVEKGATTIVEERVKNQSEIVAGTKIAMKVNVNNQTNGWFGIPKGSADTKTWYTVEEGSATGTIILKTDDGKYIGTNTSTSAPEYVNAAADATNIYLEAEGDGTDNAKYMFKNSAGTTNATAKALALTNNSDLQASWWDRGSAPRIRLEVYKQTEVEEAPEVVLPTEDANVIVSPNNGTGVGSSFTKQWISNDKLVTISVAANNMQANNGNIDFRSGQAKSATYTITPADGYYVSGYSFVTTGASSITITGNGSSATASAEGTPFSATVTEGTAASFTVADNANSQNVLSNFHVRLTPVGAQPSTNIDGSELAPVVYTIDKANGELYKNGAVSTGFCSQWKSSDNAVTFTSNANNMQWAVSDTNHIDARSGGTKNATYTLASTNPEYVIESYSFKAKALTSNQTWKQGSNTYTATTSGVITIADDNVDEQAVQFILTDADNSGTLLTDFTVKLKKVELDPALAEPEKMTVLDNAHSSVPYRIPAIASTKDGVLVVAADYRFTHADIGGGRLDLHIRRSFDYGKTWESEIIKPSNMVGDGNCTNHNDFAGFGDPCIVADRESNKMMILSCAGYPGFFQCTRDQHQRCARWYSEDNGATWTGPEFIDNQFVFEPLDNNSFGPAQGMFFGSGKIHQSRYVKVKDYYRLYASNSVRNSGGTIRNYVMYSDDFGQTWNFLGGVDAPAVSSGGDEPKVEELPDGSVLFSGRRNGAGGRNFNIFRFSNDAKTEGQWLGNTVSNANVNGITNDNACNGEIQLVPVVRKKDNQKMWLALQSVPFGSGRNNVGIFYKPLATEADYATPAAIASNWEGKHQSSWTSSCYSTMVLQGDKNIGFVYEENGYNGGYDIQYKNYSIEVITKGKYGFDPDYAMPDVVLPLHAAGYTPAAGTVEKVETITVQYNKPLTLKQANVTLGDGVVASASVEDNVLTLTLANAITSGGKHELTIPAGVVADNDAQVNDPVSITYRIIGEEQPLGDQVTSLEGISNFKTYALYNPASKGYATYAPQQSTSNMWAGEMQDMDANHQVKNTAYSVDVNHADPNSAWMIVNYKGSTYLYNVGAEKFVSVGRPTTLGDAKAINIAKIENGFTFISNEGAQNYMCASPQLDQPVTTWTNTDNGSCWQLIENPNVEEDYERCISLIDSSFLLGDANGNTTLEREDVGSLIDYLLVRREDEAPAQCDVNKDTMISIGDVARLIRRLLESAKK